VLGGTWYDAYAATSWAIQGTWLGNGGIGDWVYDLINSPSLAKDDDKKNDNKEEECKVKDKLKGKNGSIKNAPLPKGSPSWGDIKDMTLNDVTKKAQ
jgi:hypothetical protein